MGRALIRILHVTQIILFLTTLAPERMGDPARGAGVGPHGDGYINSTNLQRQTFARQCMHVFDSFEPAPSRHSRALLWSLHNDRYLIVNLPLAILSNELRRLHLLE